MEKKIDRIYKARERRCKRNQIGIVLFGMPFHGASIICGILGSPWFFVCWIIEKVRDYFKPQKFDKEEFRKWLEKPRNFKRFIFFWDDNSFCLGIDKMSFSNFARNLKKWRKFTSDVYQYLLEEYEIEGYDKEVCEGIESCQKDIDFYKKDSQ